MLIFIPLNFTFIAFYFEPLVRKISYSNRDNSNSLIVLQLYQIVGMLVFSAFSQPEDDVKLLLFLIIGSVVLLNTFSINNSFHSNEITKLWNWVAMENIWSVICLLISFALKLEKIFIPFLWIFGGVVFTIFTFTTDTYREKSFYRHINKIDNEKEFCYHVGTLIKKIWRKKERKSDDVEGYIHMHKMYCLDPGCPLKEDIHSFKVESGKGNRIERAKKLRVQKFLDYIFKRGLNKFSVNVNLRIQYAYYLYEFLNNRQSAAEQLALAEERGGLSIQESFKIFRLRKFLESGTMESGNSLNNGINIYKKNNILKSFKNSLEKISYLYNDFWNNLLQHTPEFTKIMKLGRVIQREMTTVERYSKYLEFNNPNDFKSLENLARFWIYVTYDKKRGERALET